MESSRPLERVVRLVPFVLIALCFTAPARAVVFVSADAPGPVHDGASWDTAFPTLQEGLDHGDPEIWVAGGVYPGAVTIRHSATLLGGFDAIGSTLDARDPKEYPTVLEAAGAPILVTGASADSIVLDGFTLHGAPDGTAVTGCSILRRCVITNSGTGVARTGQVAGCVLAGNTVGVLIRGAATVSGCVLQGNATAIEATTAAATVCGNTLVGNGTAVRLQASATTLGNNILAWNAVGLDSFNTSIVPEYNCLYGNGADSSTGTVFSVAYGNMAVDPRLTGGAVGEVHLMADSPCREAGANDLANVSGPEWDGNARVWPAGGTIDMGADEFDGTAYTIQPGVAYVGATGSDGADGRQTRTAKRTLSGAQEALFGRGGEIRALSGTLPTSTTLYLPVALMGRWRGDGQRGGLPTILTGVEESTVLTLASRVAPVKVDGITFRGAGTGVDATMGDALLTSCILCGNLDALAVSGGRPGLVSCTVAGNQRGLAIYAGTASAVNTIFANNATGVYREAGLIDVPLVRYCLFNGNAAATEGTASPVGSNGNRDLLPSFVDDAHGDFHLAAGSGAIYGGDRLAWAPNARDMDGEAPRISGAPDIGADQYHADTPRWQPLTICVTPDGDDSRSGLSWDRSKRSLAAAIEAAAYPGGGTAIVAGGTYTGPLAANPFVKLAGGYAPGATQPDPDRNPTILTAPRDAVLTFTGGHTYGSVSGFTIRDGESGVTLKGASPTLTGNVIRANTTALVGWDASPTLVRNTVLGNIAGLRFEGGRPRLFGNTIRGQALEGVSSWNGAVEARGNAFLGNTGAGLHVGSGEIQAINNTFIGNKAGVDVSSVEGRVGNSIFAGNAIGVRLAGKDTAVALLSNDFFANGANAVGADEPVGMTRNVGLNPDVASLAYGEPHIQPGSICRRQGDPSLLTPGQTDIDGQPVWPLPDIGADQASGLWVTVTPSIVRVSPTGDDAADGASWVTAKRTIQAGLDALAASGGELRVAAGAYAGPLALPAFVHVTAGYAGQSDLDPRVTADGTTVVNGAGLTYAVKLRGGGEASATWDGFTMRGGTLGMISPGAGATVSHNTISDCRLDGFSETGGASLFARNTVRNNGGGVVCRGSRTTVLNNIILSNGTLASTGGHTPPVSGGVRAMYGGAPVIAGNFLDGNHTGVATYKSPARILNNTIVSGRYGISYGYTTPEIVNNIVDGAWYAIYPYLSQGAPTMRNNDVVDSPVPYTLIGDQTGQRGNIAVRPGYRDPCGNFRLGPGSPCIDAGDTSVVFGPDLDGRARPIGAAIDIGAYEYAAPVFGIQDAVKALKAAGGLWQPGPADVSDLDYDGTPGVGLRDTVFILRNALGVG